MTKFLTKLLLISHIIISLFMGSLYQTPAQSQAQVFGSFTPAQTNPSILAGAGINSSQTTITLTAFTLPDQAKTPVQMSMLGSIGYGVLEPQSSKIESISFTGVTQNVNGSAVLTGVSRGLSFYSPYQASTTLQLSHAGGSNFIITNSAAFYGQQFAFTENSGTFIALQNFTNPPIFINAATSTKQGASVAYVNSVVAAGCANASESVNGCSQLATQLQMASSTTTGSTGANLVLQSKYATSSPSIVCGLCIPITRNDGKISPQFVATTSSDIYNFGGSITFLASTTQSATTTISASSVTNNALVLNSLPYKWPSTRAASSTTLTEDGNGNLSFQASHDVYSGFNTAGTTAMSATFATTTLITIPAGIMTASSTIEITGAASCVGTNGAACTVYLKNATGNLFGLFNMAARTGASGSDSSGSFTMTVLPVSSITSQQTLFTCSIVGLDFTGGGSTPVLKGCQGGGNAGTSSFNFAAGFTLNLVLQAGTSVTANDSGISVIIHR